MYEVIFTDNSSNNINAFIDWYLNSFLDLFTDTWLYEEKILWFSKLENWNLEITTIVGNYRLFIEFFEEKENKLRFVENIRFFNK